MAKLLASFCLDLIAAMSLGGINNKIRGGKIEYVTNFGSKFGGLFNSFIKPIINEYSCLI